MKFAAVNLSLSTELCVIGLFAAAAVIALAVRPAARGPVRQHLLAGSLSAEGPEEESIDIEVDPAGGVTIWRNGLGPLTSDDAVSLAVNIRGFDIEMVERTALSRSTSTAAQPVDSARFSIDFLAQEHYNVIYKIDSTVAAAFSLTPRPGLHRHIALSQ